MLLGVTAVSRDGVSGTLFYVLAYGLTSLAAFGIIALVGGLVTINPIWLFGPFTPDQVSAGSQPDFYMMWTEGLARIWPAWEFYPFGHTIPAVIGVALIMGLVTFGLGLLNVPGIVMSIVIGALLIVVIALPIVIGRVRGLSR